MVTEQSVWRPMSEQPDVGRKFIALQGNDAVMFFHSRSNGFIDGYGVQFTDIRKHFVLWTYLPDDYEIWYEA